jgi:hypothetical protein
MLTEKIEKVLTDKLTVGIEFPDGVTDAEDLPFAMILGKAEAAAEIAAAHAEEMDNFRLAVKDQKADFLKAMRQLVRQRDACRVELAEMREVIRFVREEWFERYYPSDIFTGVSGDEGVLDVIEIKQRLDKALAATPKRVRWVMEGRWTKDSLGWWVLTLDPLQRGPDENLRIATILSGSLNDRDGESVTVAVMEGEEDEKDA